MVLGALALHQQVLLWAPLNSSLDSRAGTDPQGPLNREEPAAGEMGLA